MRYSPCVHNKRIVEVEFLSLKCHYAFMPQGWHGWGILISQIKLRGFGFSDHRDFADVPLKDGSAAPHSSLGTG